MTNATVTLDMLVKLDACVEQRQTFNELFGDGVTVTRELCREHAAVFDWGWAASNLLVAPARRAYDEAAALAFADAFLSQVDISACAS